MKNWKEHVQKTSSAILKGVATASSVYLLQKIVSRYILKEELNTSQLKNDAVRQVSNKIIESIMSAEQASDSGSVTVSEKSMLEFFFPTRSQFHVDDFDDIDENIMALPALFNTLVKTSLYEIINKNYKIKRTFCEKIQNHLNPVRINKISVGEENFVNSYVDGYICFVDSKGTKLAIKIFTEMFNGVAGNVEILFYCKKEDVAQSRSFTHKLNKHMRENTFLKGRAIDNTGEIIDVDKFRGWEEIYLDPKLKEKIKIHTTDFMNNLDLLRSAGLKTYRGVLLHGRPGTGKTMISKSIAKSAKNTNISFISILCTQVNDYSYMSKIFELARWISPTILLLDDVDKFPGGANVLINELDGTKSNENILVVATANDLRCLGESLANRPNRFDLITEIAPPVKEIRREFFEKYCSSEKLEKIVAITENLTMSHCKEIIERTKIEEILRNKNFPDALLEVAEEVSKYCRYYADEIL